jgi:Protein of unknown function (DUF2934)
LNHDTGRVATSPDSPRRDSWPGGGGLGRYWGEEHFFTRRIEAMKSRNGFANTDGMPKIVSQSDIAEEEKNSGPSPAEIRQRAFEIHIERGGIHGCDLDDWLQAERELQEKYNKSNDGGRRRNDVHTDTIVLAIAKTPAIDRP